MFKHCNEIQNSMRQLCSIPLHLCYDGSEQANIQNSKRLSAIRYDELSGIRVLMHRREKSAY